MNHFLVLFLSLVLTSCVVEIYGFKVPVLKRKVEPEDLDMNFPIAPKIYKGTLIQTTGKYPFVVALVNVFPTYSSQICAGALIASRTILTAAHCLPNFGNNSEPEVWLGMNHLWNWDPTRVKVKVDLNSIQVHPRHDPWTLEHDVALITLASPVQFSGFIQPICLGIKEYNHIPSVTLAGWGNTDCRSGSPTLLEASGSAFPRCLFGPGQIQVPDSQICARLNGGAEQAPGDSGGPLFMTSGNKFVHVGVVSKSRKDANGCPVPGELGVYSRTSYYIDWITAKAKENVLLC